MARGCIVPESLPDDPGVVRALTGPFAQHAGADWRDLAVLTAWGAVGAVVAVRRFRWDPRREHAGLKNKLRRGRGISPIPGSFYRP